MKRFLQNINPTSFLQHIFIFTILFCVVIGIQFYDGAFNSEFVGYPDEPAHYVTGMMVRDYTAALTTGYQSPMSFASEYYLHYPKVSLGHWPPVYYVIQGLWYLVFAPSRIAVCLLMGLLTALVAGTVYLIVRNFTETRVALCAALVLIVLPIIREFGAATMTEVPLALFTLWAVWLFARYIETGKTSMAVAFGLMAITAILTKANAIALGLVPPLAIVFTRRFRMLLSFRFWIPAVMVAAVCGPYQWVTLPLARGTWTEATPNLQYTLQAFGAYAADVFQVLGIAGSIPTAIGFVAAFVIPLFKKRVEVIPAVMGAFIFSVLVFNSLVPSSIEARNLIICLPELVIFAAYGLKVSSEIIGCYIKSNPNTRTIVLVLMLVVIGENSARSSTNPWGGFDAMTRDLVAETQPHEAVILVVSDSEGEGMFIASLATREERPGRIVLRSSKVLAKSDWLGRNYKAEFKEPDELARHLANWSVAAVVLDRSDYKENAFPHFGQIEELLENARDKWRLFKTYSLYRNGALYPDAVDLYLTKNMDFLNQKILNPDTKQQMYLLQLPHLLRHVSFLEYGVPPVK